MNATLPSNIKNYWELSDDDLDVLFAQLKSKVRAKHNIFVSIMFQWIPLARAFFQLFLDDQTLQNLILTDLVVQNAILNDEDVMQEYRCDILYQAQARTGSGDGTTTDIALLLEHKAQQDYFVIRQAKKYVDLIHQAEEEQAIREGRFNKDFRFTIVVPIVLYHGEGKFCGAYRYRDLFPEVPGLEPYIGDFKLVLIDLNTISESRLEESKNIPELWFVLRIMKAIFQDNLKEEMVRIFQDLRQMLLDKNTQGRYRTFARLLIIYILSSAHQLEMSEIKQVVKENLVQGEKVMKTIAEQLFDEGDAQGFKRGDAQGFKRAKIESIIMLLTSKHFPISSEVRDALSQIYDMVVLDSLFQTAIASTTIEEFERALF